MELSAIFDGVIRGDEALVIEMVQDAVACGAEPTAILSGQLIPAMEEVGARFERAEFFVPEMLLASRAMQSGLEVLKPLMVGERTAGEWRVVIGTVQSDVHDLGKNLVATMLAGAGFRVTDLGAGVSPQSFVEVVHRENPNILAMSALMTTTMSFMKRTLDELMQTGLRDSVKVLVGGAPLTEQYSREIGADGYASDAWSAVKKARELIGA
jgi:5-methyltetrahydrofolate--homocysteine methyltransferase